MLEKIIKSWPALVFTVLLIAAAHFSGVTQTLDKRLYDYFLRFKQAPAPKDVVIIAIDEKSIEALGKWPWPRDVHIQLLERLQHYRPQLVALDILFTEPDINAKFNARLAAVVQTMGSVILPIYIGSIKAPNGAVQVFSREPYTELTGAVAALGHVQLHPDADGVERSIYLKQGVVAKNGEIKVWPHLSLAAYDFLESGQKKKTGFLDTHQNNFFVKTVQEEEYYIPFAGPAETFHTISYIDVILGYTPAEQLRNKILFVGATAIGLGDNIVTPVTGDTRPMPGVEGHANIFQAIRAHSLISWLPYKPVAYISLVLCILIASLGIWFSARAILLYSACLGTLLVLMNYVLLKYWHLWLPSATMILSLATLYPLWSFYRLGQMVRFLGDELSKAKYLPDLFASPQELVEFQTGLNSFLMGGLLSAWWINDRSYSGLITAGEIPYQHDARLMSEGQVNLAGKNFRWSCVWVDETTKNNAHKFLDEYSNIKSRQQSRGQLREFLSASIAHLRNANQQMWVMLNMARKTLHNIQNAVLVLDTAGRVLFANHSANRLFKLPEITVENQHIFYCMNVLFEENTKIHSLLKQIMFQDQPVYEEIALRDERYFLLQANKVELALAKDVVLITLSDITAMKKLQEARAEALQFLSHDLRSPMVSILTLLEEAKGRGGVMDAETIDACVDLARKNLSYANNYLQIVRAEESTMNTALIDAVGVFDAVIASVYVQAKERQIRIVTHWPEEVVWVDANVDLLSRALQNLLDNALKYSPQTSTVEVSVRLDEERGVGFDVKDQGIGVPEADWNNIFKSFKRATNAKRFNTEGTGLGLRFVDVVGKRHNGSVEFKACADGGSHFTLWLPKAQEYVQ